MASGSYTAAGDQLIRLLVERLPLVDWQDGPPGYTEGEAEAIRWSIRQFQHTSRQVAEEMGGEALAVHPDRAEELERMLYEQGLRQFGDSGWKMAGKVPENWQINISAYLKAWICGLNPMVLLDIAELLALAGKFEESGNAIEAVRKFPEYARSQGADGPYAPEIVRQVTDRIDAIKSEPGRLKAIETKRQDVEFDQAAEEFARQLGPMGRDELHVTLDSAENPRVQAFNAALQERRRPRLLVPPCITDPGVIERVRVDGDKCIRETWDSRLKIWRPGGPLTDSLMHGRELSPEEISEAGIPAEE
jgi:hypothetical protein